MDKTIKKKHFEVVYEKFSPVPMGIKRVTEHAASRQEIRTKYRNCLENLKTIGEITDYTLKIHLIYDPDKDENKDFTKRKQE